MLCVRSLHEHFPLFLLLVGMGTLRLPPGQITEPPLVKLYLVFLLHSSLEPCAESSLQDALDRQKCLTSLASLRQAKWFQVCIPSLFV